MRKEDFLKITDYIGSIIKGTSYENHVYGVGGSIRDFLMGNDIKDIDLVIDLPQGGVKFANWCKEQGYTKTVVIYENYGTAAMKILNQDIECVMTRGEKYLDDGSRNPTVEFADINEDAFRRDLTINALYYNVSTGKFLDPTGYGINDIENKICRTPMELNIQTKVDQTFIDDPLRILRCIRMSCKFGFTISDETYKAMKRNVRRLKIITKERIQAEFNKIMMSENAVMGINMLHDIGAMTFIVPEFEKCYGLTQNRFHFGDVAEHTLAVLDYHCKHFDADLTERLACFLHDIGKIMTMSVKDGKVHFYDHEYVGAELTGNILRELKYDTDTIKKVQFLIRNHMRTKQAGDGAKYMKDKSLHKLLYECKTFEMFKSLMRIIECDNEAHAKDCCIHNQYSELVAKVELEGSHSKMFGYKLPVTGEDIMSVLGLEPGPIIAEINKRLLNQAFMDPEISKERCIKLLPGIKKQAEQVLKK